MIKVTVKPISTHTIIRLQNSWSVDDYKSIIDQLGGEIADLKPSEIEEYMEMMISDNELPESAYELLNFVLGENLTEGQLRNLAHEMEDDKMWEEYLNMAYHREIFRVNQLLYKSYNGKVPKGEATVLAINVICKDPSFFALLLEKDADAILRLIMGGMDDHSKIQRLFEDEAKHKYLEDAKHILWHTEVKKISDQEINIEVTSSEYWLDAYHDEQEYSVDIDLEIYDEEEAE